MKTRTVTLCLALASARTGLAQVAPASQPAPPAQAPAAQPTAAPGTGGGPPPPYTPVRWNENYSYLKNPARRADALDGLKYIPLNDAGDWYVSLGGSARYRYELFNNNNFGAGPQDDTGFHLTRLFAHADLHAGENLRGFFQVRSGMIDGRNGGPRPIDADEFDLQQAFVDVKLPLGEGGPSVTLRAGRQELMYGAQRLIGPLDWANWHRTYDGGKAVVQFSKTHSLDLFVVHPVVVENEEPNPTNRDAVFAGAYDTIGLPKFLGEKSGSKLELYGLYLGRTDFGGFPPEGAGDEDRFTVGFRVSSNPKPFDLDVEAAYQFGTFGGGDISAWMVAFEGGYTFADAPAAPRLIVGFDAASGDDDPGDGDLGTFNQLFPTGHPFFGYIDVIGRQNIVAAKGGAEITPLKDRPWVKKMTLRGEYHAFWRQSGDDALYNDAGAVQRADVADVDERFVGTAADLLLNWQIDRHLSAYFGYSHFFAGDFIEQTGPAEDIDYVYAAVQFIF